MGGGEVTRALGNRKGVKQARGRRKALDSEQSEVDKNWT